MSLGNSNFTCATLWKKKLSFNYFSSPKHTAEIGYNEYKGTETEVSLKINLTPTVSHKGE